MVSCKNITLKTNSSTIDNEPNFFSADFISIYRVGDPAYGDGTTTLTLPTRSGFSYSMTVDWGDGFTQIYTTSTPPSHTYSLPGDYQVVITGQAQAWYFNNTGDKDKLIKVESLGDLGWISLESAFYGCSNLNYFGGGDISAVTNLNSTFRDTNIQNFYVKAWNTSNVTILLRTFLNADGATPNVSSWDVSNVTNMYSTFADMDNASPDVSSWNTSNVTTMYDMFGGALKANPDVSNFDTSSVTNLGYMFNNTQEAKPDVSNFDTSNVTNLSCMFCHAQKANPDVRNWDVSNVQNFFASFANMPLAQIDTGLWSVTNSATDMGSMFQNSPLINPDVRNWDVSNVTDFGDMFRDAVSANPDVSLWNVSGSVIVSSMFRDAISANPNVTSWDVSGITNFESIFRNTSFDRNLSTWNFSSATNLRFMFRDTNVSTVNYDAFLIRVEATNASSGLEIHAEQSQFTLSSAAETARTSLQGRSWTINDGGGI